MRNERVLLPEEIKEFDQFRKGLFSHGEELFGLRMEGWRVRHHPQLEPLIEQSPYRVFCDFLDTVVAGNFPEDAQSIRSRCESQRKKGTLIGDPNLLNSEVLDLAKKLLQSSGSQSGLEEDSHRVLADNRRISFQRAAVDWTGQIEQLRGIVG